jgi:hypothetical protein
MQRKAILSALIVAILSLTFPFCFEGRGIHAKSVGPTLFLVAYFDDSSYLSIDWNRTIHLFLWLSTVGIGLLWLVSRAKRAFWIWSGIIVGVIASIGVGDLIYRRNGSANSSTAKFDPGTALPVDGLENALSAPNASAVVIRTIPPNAAVALEAERDFGAIVTRPPSKAENFNFIGFSNGTKARTVDDGKRVAGTIAIGRTPMTLHGLPFGNYRITISLEGYKKYTGEIDVRQTADSLLDDKPVEIPAIVLEKAE